MINAMPNNLEHKTGPQPFPFYVATRAIFDRQVEWCQAATGREANQPVERLAYKGGEVVATDFMGAQSIHVAGVDLPTEQSPHLRIVVDLYTGGERSILSQDYDPYQPNDSPQNAAFIDEVEDMHPQHSFEELIGGNYDGEGTYIIHAAPDGELFAANIWLLNGPPWFDTADRLAELREKGLVHNIDTHDAETLVGHIQDAQPDLREFNLDNG
jgi:hypothetical protein